MVCRGPSALALLLSAGTALPGCATQRDTAQALTITGAAAVVIGASMAADEQCYSAGAGEGGVQSYCAPGLSKGARTAGKGLAVAGVGLAAAGYALNPKGPDRLPAPADPDAVPVSPYRLVRRNPAPESFEAASPPPESAPAASPPSVPGSQCSSGSPATESKPGAGCGQAAPAAPAAAPEPNTVPDPGPVAPR